ncbi:MAG: Uncharacterized protein Athens071425_536 [Parcubacteria group bacterium Athens0714_25]|nr:MAG: Uncharacterized protein Athens071425_536 [Parcubacteria group bacterium Athens0714_25]
MFFHFQSFIFSLIFALGLELIALKQESFFYVLFFLIFLSFWANQKIYRKISFAVIPILFSLSSMLMLYLIDQSVEKQVFIALSFFMYYLTFLSACRIRRYKLDQTARGLLAASLMVTIFFFYTSVYGVYLNFAISLWFLMAVFLVATFLASYQYLEIINLEKMSVWKYSVILGLIMSEISWVVNFWPFGYLTTGVILLIFYYIIWDIIQSYFLKLLSKKRVVANMVFFSLLIGIILLSSRWLPNV